MPKKKNSKENLCKSEEAYQIHRVPIQEITNNLNNPRTISDKDFQNLVRSIKNDGFMLAIRFLVVDKEMVIVGGNQRFRACQEAGLTHVYVVKAEDLSSEQLKEFVIKDNLAFGEWDKPMLSQHYQDRELVELGMDLIEVADPRLEVIGGIEPEIDKSDLDKRKEAYENNEIKQVVVYYPADFYEKVIQAMDEIKKHMCCNENPEMLLKLISYWKVNHAN